MGTCVSSTSTEESGAVVIPTDNIPSEHTTTTNDNNNNTNQKIKHENEDKNKDEDESNQNLKENAETIDGNFNLSDVDDGNANISQQQMTMENTPDTENIVDIAIDDDLDDAKNDNDLDDNDIKNVLDAWKHRKFPGTIHDYQLVKLMEDEEQNYLVIDVRDPTLDYPGGHINGCANIEYGDFIKNIPNIISKYNAIENIIIHCMYSQSRGPTCCQWYCLGIECLLKNYGKNKNEQTFDECLSHHNDFEIIKTINLNEETYKNLRNQNILLLKGGFRNFVNKYKNNQQFVEEFDMKHWEYCNFGGKKELYHKNDW